jgi:MoaA/NifB/PqqE/SkfB family radical SAM enzyme
MCPRELYELPQWDMPFAFVERTLEDLPKGTRRVIFTGWGEPLLHPQIFDMIRSAKSRDLEVQLTTNGLLLDDRLVERLLGSEVDFLNFSVESVGRFSGHAGHPSLKAIERIEQFLAVRNGGGRPFVSVQTTMHPGGIEEVLDVVRWSARVGIDRVSLIRLNPRDVPGLRRPSWREEQEIVAAAESVADVLGIRLDHNNAFGRGWVRVLYRTVRPYLYRRDQTCGMPYDTLYVTVEGKATPCCSLPKYYVGDARSEALREIWSGGALAHFHRNQARACGSCDILKARPFSSSRADQRSVVVSVR